MLCISGLELRLHLVYRFLVVLAGKASSRVAADSTHEQTVTSIQVEVSHVSERRQLIYDVHFVAGSQCVLLLCV